MYVENQSVTANQYEVNNERQIGVEIEEEIGR